MKTGLFQNLFSRVNFEAALFISVNYLEARIYAQNILKEIHLSRDSVSIDVI
jgi:hypothetical protein